MLSSVRDLHVSSNFYVSRQTQSVDSRFLPIFRKSPPHCEEADIAVAFKPYHDNKQDILEGFRSKQASRSLSKPDVGRIQQQCDPRLWPRNQGVGRRLERSDRSAGGCCSAGLQKMQEMRGSGNAAPQKLLLGWLLLAMNGDCIFRGEMTKRAML